MEISDTELASATVPALLNLLAARWELHPDHRGQSGRAHILSIFGKSDPWYTQVLNGNTEIGVSQWLRLARALDSELIMRWIELQIRNSERIRRPCANGKRK